MISIGSEAPEKTKQRHANKMHAPLTTLCLRRLETNKNQIIQNFATRAPYPVIALKINRAAEVQPK